MARPTIYNKEILDKAKKYVDVSEDTSEQQTIGMSAKGTELFKNKVIVHLPTIEGLALYLEIHKDTIYEWEKIHPEFSDVIGDLRAKQAKELINKGLSGDYNPTIAKVLLTKHGYREGIDQTTNNKDLPKSDVDLDALANKMAEKLKEEKIHAISADTTTL